MDNNNTVNRLPWIDWMKIIGIYFITLGHFWPKGYEYIYVFSVPLFYTISGFLCRREQNIYLFWRKLLHNLVIPMLIFAVFNFIWTQSISILKGEFDINTILIFIKNIIIGNQGLISEGTGLGAMWFVYTLCILKVLLQFLSEKLESILVIVLTILFVSINVDIHEKGIIYYNSWVNSIIAFPFFIIGFLLGKHKEQVTGIKKSLGFVIAPICALVVYLCGHFNSTVGLHIASYGDSYLLFFIGAIAGIIAVYFISRFLETIDNQWVLMIGGGTIVILGFQSLIVKIWTKIGLLNRSVVLDCLLACFVIVSFIPINTLVKKYLPIVWGSYRSH